MSYDPFARGPFPVGVRTIEFRDSTLAARPITAEIWYPATDAHRGKDVEDASRDRFVVAPGVSMSAQDAVRDAAAVAGVFPMFLYFHGGYGHRREATGLCTHMASHGYIVSAVDFPGDNIADLLPRVDGSEATIARTPVDESAKKRPTQASLLIDQLLEIDLPAGLRVNPDAIGTGGMSMGGFTSLALNSVDQRPKASFPICPMFGSRSLVPQMKRLQQLLRVDDWQRPVPTCVLTGEMDPFVNVEDIRDLYHQLTTPKRLVVLARGGHLHFADGAESAHETLRLGYLSGEFSDPELHGAAGIALGTAMRPFAELCTEAESGATARSLCLAHMDAWLTDRREARAFLDGDLERPFAERGIALTAMAEMSTRAVVA